MSYPILGRQRGGQGGGDVKTFLTILLGLGLIGILFFVLMTLTNRANQWLRESIRRDDVSGGNLNLDDEKDYDHY